MDKVRFGFIGAGKISQFSAEAVNKHENGQVVAVQDLNQDRLNELADDFDIEHRFATSDELFACPEVDAVYIAVPNRFHAELSIAAMKAGKHVVLEKPFAMSATEAEEVIAVSKETGRIFTLGMNQRFTEDAQKIKALCEKGALGEIYYAKAYWLRREGIPKLGTWFGNKELAGAGAINDIGVHVLDLCLHTIGNFDPVSVYGVTYTKFGNRGLGEGGWGLSEADETIFNVDDLATALIRMRNGATVSLEVSWAAHVEDRNKANVELFGTEAGASMYPAKIYKRDPLDADYRIIENVAAPVSMPHADRFHNFINHLIHGEALYVTAEQALVVQRILDAVSESCKSGKAVEL